jgi:hypothetical protein
VWRVKPWSGRSSKVRQASGGRSWWTHFELTRINIELTILPKKIEDLRDVGAPRRAAGEGGRFASSSARVLSRGGRTHMKVVKCFLDRDAERLLRCSGKRRPGHFHNVRAGT